MSGRTVSDDEGEWLQRAKESDSIGHHATAVAYLEMYLRNGRVSFGATLALANNLWRIGRTSDAVRVLDGVREMTPRQEYLVSVLRGEMDMERGDLLRAESSFRAAIRSEIASSVPFALLGSCLMRTERYTEAYDMFAKASSYGVDVDEHYFNMGNCKRAIGQFECARDCYLKAKEINPAFEGLSSRLDDVVSVLRLSLNHE